MKNGAATGFGRIARELKEVTSNFRTNKQTDRRTDRQADRLSALYIVRIISGLRRHCAYNTAHGARATNGSGRQHM
uniref:Transposase n=1 Tax=Haemonchus contortus TaxID=6289 RepID=A0A7I4Z0C8_HAECO